MQEIGCTGGRLATLKIKKCLSRGVDDKFIRNEIEQLSVTKLPRRVEVGLLGR